METPVENLPSMQEDKDPLHITLSVREGKKTFRVSGPEYEIMHNSIVPAGASRKETDTLLSEWVKKHFPYSRQVEKGGKTRYSIDSYPTLLSLFKALKNNEIDGVICTNSAAVLLGLLTKGKGEGSGYHFIGFYDQKAQTGHAVIFDYVLNKYIDPQVGVVTFKELQARYPQLPMKEEEMRVLVPGKSGTQKAIVASTGEQVKSPHA